MFNFECTSLCDFAFSSCWLGQDVLAVVAGYDGLGMTEHNIGFVAAAASDVHEVGVGGRDEPFEFVAVFLSFLGRV